MSVRSVLAAGAAAVLFVSAGVPAAAARSRSGERCDPARARPASATRPKWRKIRVRRPLAPVDYTAIAGLSKPTFTGVQRTTHALFTADGTPCTSRSSSRGAPRTSA